MCDRAPQAAIAAIDMTSAASAVWFGPRLMLSTSPPACGGRAGRSYGCPLQSFPARGGGVGLPPWRVDVGLEVVTERTRGVEGAIGRQLPPPREEGQPDATVWPGCFQFFGRGSFR